LPRGERELPARCIDLCRRADLIIHCGDFTSLAFWEQLSALGPPVAGVHGNMDEPELQELLPKERVIRVEQSYIGMVHIPGPGAGREARLRAKFPDCNAVIYGHTHVPDLTEDEGVWILNPGSPTEKRESPGHAMLVLAVGGKQIAPKLVEL
jgi:putative phosphoesterase